MLYHRTFSSQRLSMVLITKEHASLLLPLLQHPDLYTFLPQDPPSLDKLEQQYAFWEQRKSPDNSEYWLNWVIFLTDSQRAIGTLQAGIELATSQASIAYLIGTAFQRQGFATEATSALIDHLHQQYQVSSIKAWIDTRNTASIRLVKKLGMRQVEFIAQADHFKGQVSDEFVFQLDR